MNTKTLISALVLTLGLGTLALPGTAAARDYDRDGDRQEHRRDRHDNDRSCHERRDRDRYDHRRHDNRRHDHIGYQGRGRWVPYIPQYNPRYRDHDHHYHRHDHSRGRVVRTHGYGSYFDPNVVLRIETHW